MTRPGLRRSRRRRPGEAVSRTHVSVSIHGGSDYPENARKGLRPVPRHNVGYSGQGLCFTKLTYWHRWAIPLSPLAKRITSVCFFVYKRTNNKIPFAQ
jgi:hypothetical protein